MADSNGSDFLSQIAVKDTNRLVGSVAKCLAANSPWIGVLRGGTFKSGVSDTVVSAVEMPAAPGDSLAAPTFTNTTDISGTAPTMDKTGKVDFSYSLQSKRGRGPTVDVNKGYAAFKSSYLTAEDSLRKLITQYINADVQYQMLVKSASKFTCKASTGFSTLFRGGTEADINATFDHTVVPDAPLTFKALHAIARHLKDGLFGEMFEAQGKGQPHFRFIGSQEIIESFRAEVGVQNVLIGLTTGGYKLGEESVSAYSFESSPAYRGIAFGVTQRPLRASAINSGTDMPTLINPVTTVTDEDTGTAYSKANSSWLAGTYEIGFLVADGTFERQTPEQYTGEGTFKFAPQLWAGELNWHYVKDNDRNQFGDYGHHLYQITRAYRPIRPQHIIPIIYKRAQTDLGLVAV